MTDIINDLGEVRNRVVQRKIILWDEIDGFLSRSMTEILALRARRDDLLRSNNAFEQRARLAEDIARENVKEIDRLTKKLVEMVTDATPPSPDDPCKLIPADQWHEDLGDVLWWRVPISEAPWCGSPLSLGYGVRVDAEIRTSNPDRNGEGRDGDRMATVPATRTFHVGGWRDDYYTHFSMLPQVR